MVNAIDRRRIALMFTSLWKRVLFIEVDREWGEGRGWGDGNVGMEVRWVKKRRGYVDNLVGGIQETPKAQSSKNPIM